MIYHISTIYQASQSKVGQGVLSIFDNGDQALYVKLALGFRSKVTLTMKDIVKTAFFQHLNLHQRLKLKPASASIKPYILSYLLDHLHLY